MSWYSNDVVEETFKNVVDVDLEIVVGRLSPELRATLMGSKYTNKGVMVEKSDDVQPEFALIVVLSQMGSQNGTLNQVYYRCKLTVEGVEAETKTDSVTDSQVTISGKAIPLVFSDVSLFWPHPNKRVEQINKVANILYFLITFLLIFG